MDNNSDEVSQRLGTSFKNDKAEARLVEDEGGKCCGCSETRQKTFIGLLIVFFLALSWVGAQQFAQSAVTSENFDSPYFVTWFSTCWMVLCFPGYFLFILATKEKGERGEAVRDSLFIFGAERLRVRQVFTVVLPFNVLWIAVNYLYIFSLKYIAATDASAIMASNVAFCYIMSLLVLGEKIYVIRAVASLICISGVVLFGYADGFQGGSNITVGVVLALVAAVGSALYKVVFKKVVGSASLGQVSLFLSLLGATNAALMWVGLLVLYLIGWEEISAASIPWEFLCGSAALGLVFNFLVNFGVAFTYPLFISVAMMLGIPVNAAVDLLLRGDMFSTLRLVAALLVVAGFTLMMCPDPWNRPLHRPFKCITSPRCYGNGDDDQEAIAYSSGEIRKGNTAAV